MAKKRSIGSYFQLGFFSSDIILRNFLFIAFLVFLATIYIANRHLSERNIRLIQEMQSELEEREMYVGSLRTENMQKRRRSELAGRVRDDGLRLHRDPPYKIKVLPRPE